MNCFNKEETYCSSFSDILITFIIAHSKGLFAAVIGTLERFGHVCVHTGHVHLEHEKGGVESSANLAIVPSLVVVTGMIFVPFQVQSQSV